ncbi:MAG: LacI family DNA-binding transcriptional regulator [Opitutaceae bacterium]|jgi:LacI family transcriptional regulator|nr:LacI family DNA-binding transcriptional regulator [Opitutaceae bacterium]
MNRRCTNKAAPDGSAKRDANSQSTGRGGRRRALLSVATEKRLLAPWAELIAAGGSGRVLVPAVRQALERKLKRTVSVSVVYRLLGRHGWRKIVRADKTTTNGNADGMSAAQQSKVEGLVCASRSSRDAHGARGGDLRLSDFETFDRGAGGTPAPLPAPTLRALATLAGVSRTTVSLALRNKPSLPVETRERIQELARQHGYQPDPAVGKLMEKIRERRRNRQPDVIAYLTAYPRREMWREHPTLLDYFTGASARARECGYQVEEFWLAEPGMTARRMSEILRNRGIDGVIAAPMPAPDATLAEFCWDYFSAVSLGYSLVSPTLCRSCNHQFHAMQLLMRELQKSGYRDIGLAMREDHDTRVNHNWQGGYFVGKNLIPGHRDIPLLLTPQWRRDDFARWLDMHHPEAVVTTGSEVREWLRELGIRTPRELGFAHGNLGPEMLRAKMTGIDQHSGQVGASAVDLLLSLMRTNERGIPPIPRLHMVEGSFVAGRTTRGC